MNYENYTYEELYRMVDSTNPLALALANKAEEMIGDLEACTQELLEERNDLQERLATLLETIPE